MLNIYKKIKNYFQDIKNDSPPYPFTISGAGVVHVKASDLAKSDKFRKTIEYLVKNPIK